MKKRRRQPEQPTRPNEDNDDDDSLGIGFPLENINNNKHQSNDNNNMKRSMTTGCFPTARQRPGQQKMQMLLWIMLSAIVIMMMRINLRLFRSLGMWLDNSREMEVLSLFPHVSKQSTSNHSRSGDGRKNGFQPQQQHPDEQSIVQPTKLLTADNHRTIHRRTTTTRGSRSWDMLRQSANVAYRNSENGTSRTGAVKERWNATAVRSRNTVDQNGQSASPTLRRLLLELAATQHSNNDTIRYTAPIQHRRLVEQQQPASWLTNLTLSDWHTLLQEHRDWEAYGHEIHALFPSEYWYNATLLRELLVRAALDPMENLYAIYYHEPTDAYVDDNEKEDEEQRDPARSHNAQPLPPPPRFQFDPIEPDPILSDLVSDLPACADKERWLQPLIQGGILRSYDNITQELCEQLPTWTQVEALYGSGPIVYGLDTCQRYQQQLRHGLVVRPSRAAATKFGNTTSSNSDRTNPSQERSIPLSPRAKVAGLWNSGTTALSQSFVWNLHGYRSNAPLFLPTVTWGKHTPLKYRFRNTWPRANRESRSHILPVVIVRDPFRWMPSMVRVNAIKEVIAG